MRFRADEKGQMLVLTALSIVALLGFIALAVDVGLLFRAKRNVQIVADAAATAGALDLYFNQSATTAQLAGQRAATANGMTSGDSNGDTVIINTPVTDGSHQGSTYVEALLSQPNPTFFMRLFGFGSVGVSARAVAGFVVNQPCVNLTNTSGADLTLQGAATISDQNGNMTCGIVDHSTSTNSVVVKGQGNNINTQYVATVGGLSAGGNSNTVPTPTTTVQSVPPPPQKLVDQSNTAGTTMPLSSCKAPTGATKNIQGTIWTYLRNSDVQPGACYSGNVLLDGAGTSSGTLNLGTGTFYFSGNVDIGNNVTSTAITLDVYQGSLQVGSTTNVQLHAPTSGTYTGTVFVAPSFPSAPLGTVVNTSSWNIGWGAAGQSCTLGTGLVFDGIIDAPGVNVTLQDQGGCTMVSGIVAGSLNLGAGTLMLINYSTVHPTTSPWVSIALVE